MSCDNRTGPQLPEGASPLAALSDEEFAALDAQMEACGREAPYPKLPKRRESRFAKAARQQKAVKLAAALRECGITAAEARNVIDRDEDWRLAARAAKVNVPSRDTRLLTIELLEYGL